MREYFEIIQEMFNGDTWSGTFYTWSSMFIAIHVLFILFSIYVHVLDALHALLYKIIRYELKLCTGKGVLCLIICLLSVLWVLK